MPTTFKKTWLFLCVFFLFACTSNAQMWISERFKDDVEIRQRSIELENLSKEREEKEVSQRSADGLEDKNDKKIINLQEINFSHSDVLSREFFENLRKKYLNINLSANDIFSLVETINQEYMQKGYIASRAYLKE
ncbi:MAG: hypothetical protein LBD46_02830 [Endomicrobium sp.]|jgi:hemolysin activation/secretion protein|nr:hypothetical protein [Endomicrobium sp.]